MTDEQRPDAAPESERAAPPAPSPTPAPAAEPAPGRKPRRSSGFARTVLIALIALAGGWMLAVSRSADLAPMLPAPVAAWITPQGAAGAGADAGAGDWASADSVAALAGRLAALESAAADAAESAEAALSATSGLSNRLSDIDAAAADGEAPDLSGLEGRVAALESALGALTRKQDALSAAQGDLAADLAALPRGVSVPPELDDRIAALETAVDEAGGDPDLGDLPARLAALESELPRYEGFFEAAQQEAADGKRAVIVATALASIDRAMTLGAPFSEELAELEDAAGEAAPAPLPEAAASGAPTREALKASFPDAAHAAISAALLADAGGDADMVAGVLARIQARVTGLPTSAIPGDSAPAVLSRARYALLNGDIDAAVAAIEALPRSAQDAMADWVAGAKLRSAADHALARWRAEIKTTL